MDITIFFSIFQRFFSSRSAGPHFAPSLCALQDLRHWSTCSACLLDYMFGESGWMFLSEIGSCDPHRSEFSLRDIQEARIVSLVQMAGGRGSKGVFIRNAQMSTKSFVHKNAFPTPLLKSVNIEDLLPILYIFPHFRPFAGGVEPNFASGLLWV